MKGERKKERKKDNIIDWLDSRATHPRKHGRQHEWRFMYGVIIDELTREAHVVFLIQMH